MENVWKRSRFFFSEMSIEAIGVEKKEFSQESYLLNYEVSE